MKHPFAFVTALFVFVSALGGCASMSGQDWVTLFDGKSLDNWERLGGANWALKDGNVEATASTTKTTSYLVSKNSYKDFDLRVEFWVSPDANSGVFMRCADRRNITDKSCYEANIFDQRPDPTYGTGAIVHRAAVSPMPKAGGKWNVYEIHAVGPEITVSLNGAVTVRMQNTELSSGPIALQYGKGVVRFRKVEIRPL